MKTIGSPIVLGALALVAAAAYIALRGARDTGRDLGAGAVDLADGVVTGAVERIGDLVGIPQTDAAKCADCKRRGDTLGASFACTASDFVTWVAAGQPEGGASGSW